MTYVYDTGEAEATAQNREIEQHAPNNRYAVCNTADAEQVAAYMPSNYIVLGANDYHVFIQGYDRFGWTLEEYVLPRLASGLIYAKEVTVDEMIRLAVNNKKGEL